MRKYLFDLHKSVFGFAINMIAWGHASLEPKQNIVFLVKYKYNQIDANTLGKKIKFSLFLFVQKDIRHSKSDQESGIMTFLLLHTTCHIGT